MSHPSLVAKVDEFGIEIARVKKAEEKKSKSKKSKKKGKGKKKGSDDSGSDDSESASEERQRGRQKKKKKGDKDEEKAKDQDLALDEDGLNLGNEGDFNEDEISGLKWADIDGKKSFEVLFNVGHRQKMYYIKYRLELGQWQYDIRGLKDSMVYAIRIRGKNKSGWGGYSVPVKAVTKKLTIDSVIMKSKEKAALLKFVSKKERKKRWKLLFRASKDGFASTQFHAKCDNKGTTITVVLSALGHVFGGYTVLPWQSGGGAYQQDSNAFIFLLRSTNKIYKKPQKWGIKNGYNAVYHSGGYGPTFGMSLFFKKKKIIFYTLFGCDTTNSSYSNAGNSFTSPVDQTLLAGSYNFLVKDYEVYQLK
ncbi:hypothetical protein RFI_19264 [Reticulomyxa filosa]|uniref:Oxidation resistance protein 1 n=1 Tax=Reticulomyxa filosa TaxID=46433 RepID=X6MWL2_RETFI|nr:hypothetical protein RFI_19264 [Reticulomyxa filosa]|eukprot:ETO18031.1 hypothetical protein RFI_19264 [Reticulomyxa filosa]